MVDIILLNKSLYQELKTSLYIIFFKKRYNFFSYICKSTNFEYLVRQVEINQIMEEWRNEDVDACDYEG